MQETNHNLSRATRIGNQYRILIIIRYFFGFLGLILGKNDLTFYNTPTRSEINFFECQIWTKNVVRLKLDARNNFWRDIGLFMQHESKIAK